MYFVPNGNLSGKRQPGGAVGTTNYCQSKAPGTVRGQLCAPLLSDGGSAPPHHAPTASGRPRPLPATLRTRRHRRC